MTTIRKKAAPQALHDGVEACRRGDWRTGFTILTRLAQEQEGEGGLPGYFYSFLGVAMAKVEGRKKEGLQLAQYATQLAPRDPVNRLNLARAFLIAHKRVPAIKQIEKGLKLKPLDRDLHQLKKEVGWRRPPAIRFLSRGHFLNKWIGKITWQAQQQREEHQRQKLETEEFERLAGGDDK